MHCFHRYGAIVIVAITVLLVAPALLDGQSTQRGTSDSGASVLQQTIREAGLGHETVSTLGYIPVLANNPSLGLAMLSSVALLLDSDSARTATSPVIQKLRQNALIRASRKYSSPWLVGFFALLALGHFVLGTGKAQHLLGIPYKTIEGFAITIVLPSLLIAVTAAPVDARVGGPTMLLAGFGPAVPWQSGLFIGGMMLALLLIMVVRLAFEVLIWLSPIPFVDAIFQILKHGFTFGLAALYFISPVAALVIAGLILFVSLLLFGWAIRLVRFAFLIVVMPMWSLVTGGLVVPSLLDESLLPEGYKNASLALRGIALKARWIKKRTVVTVVRQGNELLFLSRRHCQRKSRALANTGERVVVGRCLFWIEIHVIGRDGKQMDHVALPRTLAPRMTEMCTLLGAEDVGWFGLAKVSHRLISWLWPKTTAVVSENRPAQF